MTDIMLFATGWFGLALIATIIAGRLKISPSLVEILIGICVTFVATIIFVSPDIGSDQQFIQFLAETGAILLTFLAGAELDPKILKLNWREASGLGVIGFIIPFIACSAITYYCLKWSIKSSLLTGVALSAGGVPVVYAVMLESGLTATKYGKKILAACFINDLCTVVALALLFSSFSIKSIICIAAILALLISLPALTKIVFKHYNDRPAEMETKFILFFLIGMGAMALWADTEAVLPAYFIGVILAGISGKNKALIRRIRTVAFGLLTPFYFIRVGSYVSAYEVLAVPSIFIILLCSKIISKFTGVYTVATIYRAPAKEAMYSTLLITTGLTFGCIATLYGFTNNIINSAQYSFLIATVITSAIIPILIANKFYMPHKHLNRLHNKQTVKKIT